MAIGFRNIPSLVGQLAVAKQIEAQDQSILANQIAMATQQEKLRQLQSPENRALLQLQQQLGVQQAQAELAGLPLKRQQQELIIEDLRRQLDPNYEATQDARKIAVATAIANATNKGEQGSFDVNSGRRIEKVNGRWVATQIPLAESLGVGTTAPSVSASDILSFDPALFPGAPVVPAPPAPSTGVLTGTLEQRAKTVEDQKKEDRAFREQLQEDAQTFRSNESKLQREFLQGKDSSKTSGDYTKQQLSSVNSLTDRFQRDAHVKKATAAQTAIDIILQGLSQNNSTGDIAAINQFQSGMVDPGATVREGDVKLITSSAPLLARAQNYIPRLLKGSVLPPEMRNEMRKISIDIYNMRARNANDTAVKRFTNNAKNAGIQFEDIGEAFIELPPDGVATPEINPNSSMQGTSPSGITYKINKK